MTTIAYRDGVLAGDTLISRGDEGMTGFLKIGKIHGHLVGLSGSAFDYDPVWAWLTNIFEENSNASPRDFWKRDDAPEGDSSVILVDPSRVIWSIRTSDGRAVRVPHLFDAIGSGCDYAMGAMQVGATAREAVRAAARFDLRSGGAVSWVSLDR